MKRTAPLLAPLLALLACGEPIPESPTWFEHVQPLVAANCARCHGAVPASPVIASFRLDRYVKGDAQTFDAWDYRDAMLAAVDGESPKMPPSNPLTERQVEILRRWVASGAPKGTRDNQLPRVEVLAFDAGATVDQSFRLSLRAWDEDGDGLAVSVWARERGASVGEALVSGLGAGVHEVTVDTGVLASGRTFDFYAVLDDGYFDDPAQNQHEVLLGSAVVDHGALGTAPRVALLSPNGGETLIGATRISWSASDADAADVLSIDLDLLRVDGPGVEVVDRNLARGLPNAPQSLLWDPTGVPVKTSAGQPILYKIRVTASDGTNVRSDASDGAFTLAEQGVVTTLGWADVQGIFASYCVGCHGQPAANPALEYFRLDKYDAADPVAPINADVGVYEQRGLVYQRMVQAGTMPPQVEPQPTALELEKVGNWLLGGAPRGDAGTPGPTFTWQTPSDAAITRTSSPTVTLQWSAVDPGGGAVTGTISWVQISAASDMLASCTPGLTGWTTLAGAVVADGSATFTAPSTGYYCFRGEISAQDGGSVVSVAAKPVKYSTTPGP